MTWLAILPLLLSAAGIAYTLLAVRATRRFGRPAAVPRVSAEPVSLLKPLHGAEPRLAENLATFLDQNWPAAIELVAGVQRRDDPALDAVARLPERQAPERAVRSVIDARRHGANAKIGNLINITSAATHDLLVLSDSDMAVTPDYLATVAATLARPGIGAVTCVYRGRGDSGGWSVLAAAGITYQFLPSVLMAVSSGLAPPCMGSTIALRRATLQGIGGFLPFADVLADDNAIGQAVRAIGLETAIAPIVVTHGCAEESLGAIFAHELRWAATIRAISRLDHLGMLATYPVGWALLALPLAPAAAAGVLAAALLARLLLVHAVDRLTATRTAPRWMLLPRDLLSFGVYLVSFAIGSVEWRGSRLRMRPQGRIAARTVP